ncbi:MAG TPA: DinB family protein [Actinomycetota bacterium]|nr:DinB family protein [Actinomycetota bacterium]
MGELPTRREAIRILERERARTVDLLDALPKAALMRTGLGGGTWSPKDLIGHLATWEEFALDALAAWERGERAPIDDLAYTVPTSKINDQAVRRKAPWSLAKVRRESERTHRELLDAIASLSDARWRAPVTARGRSQLGKRLGSILGGPGGGFHHDAGHHRSLVAFVADQTGRTGRPSGAGSSARRSNR